MNTHLIGPWRAPGWLLLAALLVLLQIFAPPARAGLMAATLHDAAHLPWFALVTLLLALWFDRRRPAGWRWLLPFTLLVLAVGTESIQSLIAGRVPSLADGVRNLLGAGLGLLLWRWWTRPAAVVGILVAGLLLTAAEPVAVVWAKAQRAAQFPVLFSTSQPGWQLLLGYSGGARGRTVALDATTDAATQRALEVSVTAEPWPGILLLELNRSFYGYTTLIVDVVLATEQPILWYVGSRHAGETSGGATRSEKMMLRPGRHRIAVPVAALTPAREGSEAEGSEEVGVLLFYSIPEYRGARWQLLRVALE